MEHLLVQISGDLLEFLGLIAGVVLLVVAFGIFVRGAYKKRKDD